MKKLLLIVVAIIAVVAVATPGFVGGKVKDQIELIVEGYNNVPGYSVEIVEYDKSYFSSKARLLLKYEVPGLGDILSNEFLTVLAKEGIPVDMDISHGPIVLKPTMAIASGVAKTSIPDDAAIVKLAGKYVDVETDSEFDTIIFGLTGGAKTTSSIKKITLKELEGDVDFVMSDINTHMDLENIRLVDGYPLYDGVSDIEIGNISLKAKEGSTEEPVAIDLAGMKVFADMRSSGDVINVIYKIAVDKVDSKGIPDSPIAGKSINNFVFDMTLENFSEAVLIELSKISADPASMGGSQSAAKMQQLASDLLKNAPVFSIDKLSFELGDAEFDGDFKLSFDSDKVGDITKLAHPMMAIPALNLDLDLAFSESLLELTKRGVPSWNLDHMSEEEIAEFEKQEDQRLAMQKEQVLEQGFLKKDGDKLTTTVKFSDGKLTVNGKDQPLPF